MHKQSLHIQRKSNNSATSLQQRFFGSAFSGTDKLFVLSIIIATVLSLVTVSVYVITWENSSVDLDLITKIYILGVFLVLDASLTMILYWIFSKIAHNGAKKAQHCNETAILTFSFSWSLRSILQASAFIFAGMIPMLVASYPCYMDWDTLNQIFQMATDAPVDYNARVMGSDLVYDTKFIDHDPIAITLFFGGFWLLGDLIGNQSAGLFVGVVVQSVLSAFSLGVLCCYLRRLGQSVRFVFMVMLFCALFPVFSRYSSTLLKDSLSAPLFLIYAICFIEVFRTNGAAFANKRFILAFAILALLCMLTKKTLLILVVLSSLVMLFHFKKRWLPVLVSCFAPALICCFMMPQLVYPLLDVEQVGKQEAFAVPFQQTAFVMLERPDDIKAWELAAIDAVFDTEELESRFQKGLADPVKAGFKSNASNEDVAKYLCAYFSVGIRHPNLYVYAAFALDGQMVVPMTQIALPMFTGDEAIDDMAVYEGDGNVDFEQPEWVKDLASLVNHFSWWCISLLGIFGTTGFYGGWLPFITFVILFAYDKRMFYGVTPLILFVATLFFSPVSVTRYVLPLIYCAPLLVALLVQGLKGRLLGNTAVSFNSEDSASSYIYSLGSRSTTDYSSNQIKVEE